MNALTMIVDVPLRMAHTTWLVETLAHHSGPAALSVAVEMNFPPARRGQWAQIRDTGKNRSRQHERMFHGSSAYLEMGSAGNSRGIRQQVPKRSHSGRMSFS